MFKMTNTPHNKLQCE